MAHDRQLLDAGRAQAASKQIEEISRTVAAARATEAEAEAAHARDKTDAAFDREFMEDD